VLDRAIAIAAHDQPFLEADVDEELDGTSASS